MQSGVAGLRGAIIAPWEEDLRAVRQDRYDVGRAREARCAKLRRRAVGNQVLVSETTYSIVADILRDDIKLLSVGKRRLEGHDRTEEIYVVQHPDVALEATVCEDAAVTA